MTSYQLGWTRKDVPAVNDVTGDTPRQGGHAFRYDDAKGLWRSEMSLDAERGCFTVSFGTAMGIWGGNMVVSGARAKPNPPSSASHLWEKPETITEEILAYRAWECVARITADGSPCVRLKSLHHDYFWDGPVTTSDETPEADSEHGLYALGLFPHHRDNFTSYVVDGEAEVWGRVALSGIVVEGATGYRAERATIQELWVDPNAFDDDGDDSPEGLCKLLGDRYQCDVSVRAPRWTDLVSA